MLCRRLIPCLDVRDGRVVKGVRFRDHVDMGDIAELALMRDAGARGVATGRQWISDSGVMLRLLQYAAMLDMVVICHAEDAGDERGHDGHDRKRRQYGKGEHRQRA